MATQYRLTTREEQAIRQLLTAVDPEGKIYLFGSRTDVNRRGGDIDLFFETSQPLSLKQRLLLEYRISGACDTHIDLLVKQRDTPDEPIHAIAREGVQL